MKLNKIIEEKKIISVSITVGLIIGSFFTTVQIIGIYIFFTMIYFISKLIIKKMEDNKK